MVSNPKYLSKNVIQTLAHTDKLYVHSVFNNGINLKADDRLIFIGLKDGPSAIKIDKDQIETLVKTKVNDEVIYENRKLKLRSVNLIIDLSKSHTKTYDIQVQDINSSIISRVERIILGYNFITGFEEKISDLVERLDNEYANDVDYLDYLLGRGKGLTPSGDDFVVGMLAYHQVNPFLSEEFLDTLDKKIEAKVTTDISLNFLMDARDGYFVQEIIDLFDAVGSNSNFIAHIYNIANFGHTSGIDMLSGIFAAIRLERKNGGLYEE